MKAIQRAAAIVLVAGLSCLATAADFSSWGKKAEIAFSGYNGSETLTNFPALVVLGSDTVKGFTSTDCLPGGADLRFADSTGAVELPYEIEQWNPSGKSYVWVRVPELVDANTSIWAYWNRAGQTAPDYTTNGAVWANGFQAVWHLGESGNTRNDATAHGNTGSLVGNTSSQSGGAVAGASAFDGTGDYINDGALAAINGSSRLTVSGWVNLTTLGVADNNDDSCLFSRGPGSPAILLWYNVNQDGTDQNHVYTFHVGNTSTLADRINGNKGLAKAGQWQHVVGVMNGGARKLYVDGRWDKTTSGGATTVPTDSTSLRLGSWSQGTTMDFKGGMDEVRISNVERSAVWIMSEYLTVASNTVFQTYGGAQSAAPGMPSAATGIATNITASSAWLCGSLTSTGGSATAAIAYWGLSDGGTNAANWANSATLAAPQAPGAFSIPATGLSADSTCYYRMAASNDAGVAWAPSSAFFITGELTLTNTSDAAEATLTPGVFTVTRPGTATNAALIVAYVKTGGTAVSGVDFAPLSGTATIPAGEVSATITVTPLKNYSSMDDKTLTLSLTAAQAVLGSNTNATMTIVNEGLPGGATNVWVRSGADALASTAANWSLGHAPTNQDAIIYLGPYSPAPDMTWDLTNAVAGWVQAELYTGTVMIQTKYPGQGDFTNLVVTGDCTLDGGTWTHTANPSGNTEINRLAVKIGGNFTLGANAFVNVDGKGFAAGSYGPGRGVAESYDGYGASHGGWDAERLSPGPYGSVVCPTNLGSSAAARAGGGAVLLEVAGHCRIDGTVSAIGINVAVSEGYTAGAGGSILVRAGTLDGSGSLNARGGRAYYGGSAGGGRIAMIVANGESFGNVSATAYGGINGPGNYVNFEGSAGTVYQEHAGHQPGKGVLTIAAENSASRYDMPNWPITEMPKASAWNPAVNLDDFSRIVLVNGGTLGIAADTVMTDWDPARLQVSGPENSYIAVRGTNGLAFPSALTVTNYTLHLDVPVWAVGDWRIAANGSLGHSHNGKLDLLLDGNLTVDVGGTVSAHRRGYYGGGPGDMGGNYSNGASHGGRGGGGYVGFSATYGSVLSPIHWGSRKNTRGGGAVKLDVAGTLAVNGTIDANGDRFFPSGSYYGAGSGGSIWLKAGTFAGSGKVSANGGNGGVGPGGGGRVSLVESIGSGLGGLVGEAKGGYSSQGRYSAPGTVYRQSADLPEGAGVVTVVAPSTWTTNTYCELPPATLAVADELKLATLRIEQGGRVGLTADMTVADLYLVNGSAAMPHLYLNGHTLKVNSYRHPDWGNEAWVVYDGGQIVWRGGTLLSIR